MTQADRVGGGVHRAALRMGDDTIIMDDSHQIGWGKNSGFQALNLAARFGASDIVLVGFDFNLERGVHWHGTHRPPLTNPRFGTVDEWRAILDAQAQTFRDHGIKVWNASTHSRLTAYERIDLAESVNDPNFI